MKKKIISFSLPTEAVVKPTEKDFRTIEGGYEVDQVIFSTAFNRNRYYIQVSRLLGYADKLSKLGTNFNHDLSLTNGQYIPASVAGYTRIWSEMVNGEMEIRGTFRFTDQRVIDVMDQITAPSIELFVDEATAIISDNGEYYEDFEWVGTAQLLGVLAGSGDARNISEFREFDLNLNPIITMTEEQVKQLLEEQKATFEAEIEGIKARLTTFEEAQAEEVSEEAPETEAEVVADEAITEVEETIKQVENALSEKVKVFADVEGSESSTDQDDAGGDVAEKAHKASLSLYKKLTNQ